MKGLKTIIILLVIGFMASCDDGKSIQKYYVENQKDPDFMALDIPASMFANMEALDEEQQTTMRSIKKINVLALKAEQNPEKFENEKARLKEIFYNDKYQLLMRYGSGNRRAEFYFTGEEDAIDELIVYGYDEERGLGVARVLGEDMNPQKIMSLVNSMDRNDVNFEGIKGLGEIFKSNEKNENDSVKSAKVGTESDTIMN